MASEMNKDLRSGGNHENTDTEDDGRGINGHRLREMTSDWLGFVYRCIDSILLVAVLIYQNYTISYLITSFNRHNNIWFFLFFIDFVMIFLFICGAFFAIRFYRKLHVLNKRKVFSNEEQTNKRQDSVPNQTMFWIRFPQWLGTLPLVWICWLFYALILSAKIFLLHLQNINIDLRTKEVKLLSNLFDSNIVLRPKEWSDATEPHTVRLCLAAMTVVFLLWIEIHRNDYSNRSFECIKELTTAVVFEIFDSIDLLDLLIPTIEKHSQKMQDSTHTERLAISVLLLSTINLMLPTIGLFRLSQNSFDSHQFGLRSNIFHNCLRIGLINIPFMVLRITYWTAFDKEISIFLLKNALFLFVSFRHIISEVHELRKLKKMPKKQSTNTLPLQEVTDSGNNRIV